MAAALGGRGYLSHHLHPVLLCFLGEEVTNIPGQQNFLSYPLLLGRVRSHHLAMMQGRCYEVVIWRHYVLFDGSKDTL